MCYSKPSRSSVRFVVLSIFAFATLPLVVKASTNTSRPFHIVLSNDDGWAELNIRTTYDALIASNNSVLISAPAVDQTGESKPYRSPVRPILEKPALNTSRLRGRTTLALENPWRVRQYPGWCRRHRVQPVPPSLLVRELVPCHSHRDRPHDTRPRILWQ